MVMDVMKMRIIVMMSKIYKYKDYISNIHFTAFSIYIFCLLYTSDAADDSLRVDLGGRRIIKKKNFFQAEDGIRDS